MKMNTKKIIESSDVFKRQVNKLNSSKIEFEKEYGHNYILLVTDYHNYLFFTSNRNINHIFYAKIFNKDTIQQRLISKTSRNVTDKIWHDKDIIVYRDEKIVTYMNTDIGTTNNTNRVEKPKETLGHPFKRKISYAMIMDSKDRLQYKRECIELHTYDRNGFRKTILDDVFCTRVYRLFLRFKGYTSTEIYNILRDEKYISGKRVLEILAYLYQAVSSYHPFFYHINGLCKYNKYKIANDVSIIERTGLLDRKYNLCKVNRVMNKDSTQIKPKDVQDWLKIRQQKLDSGDLWEEIE